MQFDKCCTETENNLFIFLKYKNQENNRIRLIVLNKIIIRYSELKLTIILRSA